MSIIRVNCVDQTLVFDNTPVIASGGLEENFVQFTFCGQWDGFTKTAVFWRTKDEAYHVVLDDADSGQVPPEVTASEGVIYFGVFGVDVNGRQRTTEVLTYKIVEGAITTGTQPSAPTPDIYTQVLTRLSEAQALVEETRAAEKAFEDKMYADRREFEDMIIDDQSVFMRNMLSDQEAFEIEIKASVAEGMVPDESISAAKLAAGAVTLDKLGADVVAAIDAAHASTHGANGADPVTPASIGAMTATDVNAAIEAAIGAAIGGGY